MTLQPLLSRISEAEGADRELDWDLQETLFGIDQTSFHDTPRYTASLDAALALVERVLPGTDSLINSRGNYCCIWDSKETGLHGRWSANAATLPLAILAALLSALRHKEKGE